MLSVRHVNLRIAKAFRVIDMLIFENWKKKWEIDVMFSPVLPLRFGTETQKC